MKGEDKMSTVLDIFFDPSEQSLQAPQNGLPSLGDQIDVLYMVHSD
jgi:hypothetical protein